MAKHSLLDECNREVKSLINKFGNILAVLICDREGASVIKVLNDSKKNKLAEKNLLAQKLIGCTENVNKLEIGLMKKIHIQYQNYQMVKFNKNKLIVTIIADNEIETGTLFSLENEFNIICNAIQDYIE